MKRRECLRWLAAAPFIAPAAKAAAKSERPNILLIVADDQGYADLGCAGLADDVQTPNLDRLASRGVRFSQAYATSPICSPSRAGLITGCYQQRFGTFWYGGKGMHDPAFPTLAERLKERGYTTGYVGKFHYGGNVHHPGNRNFPLEHGFGELYGFAGGRKHYLKHTAGAEARFQEAKAAHNRQGQSLQQGPFWENEEQVDQRGFSTELLGERARDFIARHKQGPFFLQLSFNAVHNFTHQLPGDYLEERGLSGYHDWDPAKEEYYDWYRKGRKPNNPEGRAHYLGQLRYLDLEVGKVMRFLGENGLAESTIVVYIGDNGGSTPIYANNHPFRGSKYTLYEGGIRVPLIVSCPERYRSGEICGNVVSAMDVMPTLCRAAGVDIPGHIDGHDITPLLDGGDSSIHHDTLVWDTGHETAVRRGKWKYRSADSKRHADYEMVELELGEFLYDLEAGPGETVNLAEKHPDMLEELRAVHRAWRENIDRERSG